MDEGIEGLGPIGDGLSLICERKSEAGSFLSRNCQITREEAQPFLLTTTPRV